MQMPVEDLSTRILSKQIDKQDALRLFESLDKESQLQVLAIVRRAEGISPIQGGNVTGRPMRALDPRKLTDEHRAWIADLGLKYDRFVPKSKASDLEHQAHFVDSRAALRLIESLRTLQFPITWVSAEGAHLHDADGNRYIDISGEMGANLFGHRAPFLVDAIRNSLDQGLPLSGHSDMAFQASRLFCEITDHERAKFTQSGHEALMLAIRIARETTGRKNIVVLSDDASLVRPNGAAATKLHAVGSLQFEQGIPQESAGQIVRLEIGEMTSLDTIEQRAGEIAAVIVDPARLFRVQDKSTEFLKALRQLTIEKNIPLIFDERATGFRDCPKGARGRIGIQPDMAVYGAVAGSGLPMGIIAGTAKNMDLVDGGRWRSGDDAKCGAGPMDMAGCPSQSTLAIAAALAFLGEIRKQCGDLLETGGECTCFQRELDEKTRRLADSLNAFFSEERLPVFVDTFGSLFRFRFVDGSWSVSQALFPILLRMEGVQTGIDGDCFLTAAHADEDIASVIASVKSSMSALKRNGFFIEAEEAPMQDATPAPEMQAMVSEQTSSGDSPRKEMERLRALLAADLALAEESGNSR